MCGRMQRCHPPLQPASYKLVATRVTVYSSVHVDQRQVRAVHNCFLGCPFSPEYGRDCPSKGGGGTGRTRLQDRVLAEAAFICHAIHYGFCTVVAVPPGVVPKGDEDINEKRRSNELLRYVEDPPKPSPTPAPTPVSQVPQPITRNYPDLAIKAGPAKAEIKIVNFPELALSNNLPDLVTSNDLSDVERKKSAAIAAAGDLANNNIVHFDAPKKLVNTSEATTAKANPHHSQDLAKVKPKLFQEQREASKRQNSTQAIVNVPQFYFPFGKPVPSEENEAVQKRLTEVFKALPDQKAERGDMDKITQACKCPKFWRVPLYNAAGGETSDCVSAQAFMAMWRRITRDCHDDPSRFFRLLARHGNTFITPEDFNPIVQDIVDSHPGLTFLQDAPEFHSRYITTVVSRIFYTVNRSWSGRITLPELRRSNLLSVIALLEEEDDINQITDFFSYEHFYVIYCKFWELDTDHDLYIDKRDLARHQDHALSSRMIDRIFSPGTVLSSASVREGRMSYYEFVWFLLSEEDKKQPTSIEYWFRCLDIDGDGYLSMFELEFFYEEQLNKMESLGIETLPFEDCLCQLLDLVKPRHPDYITLHDLKNCKLAYIFFDTLFNLEKFLEHEQRDPFATNRDYDSDVPEPTDWEKYAADEYELLVAEEGGQDTQAQSVQGEEGDYADDFESDDDIITIDLRQKATISEPGSDPQRNKWVDDNQDGSGNKSS
ncbi:serine/threonine-protein phosphatase 2A regulatory subunit B'' subunit delta-like [Diadema setosum]|uniref:serine/threonine-protein phosphatase 2A regulatory subunit B'' subunit delta-like n=1 Tax=Diadema setosum TaxID=31175 RepID=UPI003B3B2A38